MKNIEGLQSDSLEVKEIPILVLLVGGITYGEIAGLRMLSRKYNRKILVSSTSIVNSVKIIE